MYTRKHNTDFASSRARVLAYLVKLNRALDNNTADLAQALLVRFCDSLIDYLSAGHFQVFQHVVPAPYAYAAIEATTRQAMRFNDTYGNGNAVPTAELKRALEHLAMVINTRMELEDDLLSTRVARPAAVPVQPLRPAATAG